MKGSIKGFIALFVFAAVLAVSFSSDGAKTTNTDYGITELAASFEAVSGDVILLNSDLTVGKVSIEVEATVLFMEDVQAFDNAAIEVKHRCRELVGITGISPAIDVNNFTTKYYTASIQKFRSEVCLC